MLRSVIKVSPDFVATISRLVEQPLSAELKTKLLALKSNPADTQIQVTEEEIEQLIDALPPNLAYRSELVQHLKWLRE